MDTLPPSVTRDFFLEDYVSYTAFTILFYDHFITLSDEINNIWKHPRSILSIGFLLNRYFALFANVSLIFGFYDISPGNSCKQADASRQISIAVSAVFVGALQLLRTYALYGQSLRVLVGLLAIAASLIAIAVFLVFLQSRNIGSAVNEVSFGCHAWHSQNSVLNFTVPWECLLAWDILILVLTLLKTYRVWHQYELFGKERLPLMTLLFRDGVIYFGVMSLSSLANLLTFYFASSTLKGLLSTTASTISISMMSRLIINLYRSVEPSVSSEDAPSRVRHGDFTSRIEYDEGLLWSDL